MAEINSASAEKQRAGVQHAKKLSTKVDLTPMVDLGFLLITFFIMTTKLSEPKEMNVYMPDENGPPTRYAESTSLTVIPYANNKIFYFHGKLSDALLNGQYGNTGYSVKNGIGDVIRMKQNMLERDPEFNRKDLKLIIMPEDNSNCQNFVDLLDEVFINDVKHYALVATPKELIASISDKLK